ncbi:exosortase [Alteromonas sp. 1_MG-2023]|uniref:exosortase A n=1 Tax=Alteromonas sp. 1_MG-2023 TaxID=3062669 RepID=UPI0026E3D9AC|nr:exosortase A [Alteromonas sp. 1_MG-2023]MDO6566338.1 exosortase [Alteromonas sp. 1_MG-2023]
MTRKSEVMSDPKNTNNNASALEFKAKVGRPLHLLSILLVLILWCFFCWQGLVTVVDIWWGNEIFNHGFFVVPGAFYLIYLNRKQFLSVPWKTSWYAFVVIIPSLLVYVIGVAGDVQLFLHAATFTLLPSLIWFIVGDKAARTILFPLCFMFFSVPVGEQLIPYLQEIAADGSVALLKLTGIPLFRSGLYIEIPQGRFLVAEACSGVSFFIVSFVIGSLYSYLNLVSSKRQITFVAISLVFPIMANVLRVYGIILIAYWTDMEYAAGADHLIYGWFFFAFVIVCLLGIGELMREKNSPAQSEIQLSPSWQINKAAFFCCVLLIVSSSAWLYQVKQASDNVSNLTSSFVSINTSQCDNIAVDLKPEFDNPNSVSKTGILVDGQCVGTIYEAWFSGVENELISDINRAYSQDSWSLISKEDSTVEVSRLGLSLPTFLLSSPSGDKVKYTLWFELGNSRFASKIDTKLQEITDALFGKRRQGKITIVATPFDSDLNKPLSKLMVEDSQL